MDVRLEEALKVLWLKEEGWEEKEFIPIIKYSIGERDFEVLEEKGLVKKKNGEWIFTDYGRHIASDIIRRMRLAEWLFSEIIEGDSGFSNEAACRLEHVLTEEATDKICSLFGHPKFCPHGKPIPRGKCCGKEKITLEPFILPLTYLEEDSEAKIISINIDDRRIKHKLVSMGFLPGTIILLKKKKPIYLVELEGNVISLDKKIAGKIFVKNLKKYT